ncbi:MAG: type II toxin-antitoxin system Phd/YefM family antitoxin [Rhodanobacteraceae bacterium]|nr:type II toxin-antitoxin system Phd/YefM family antitoxin [Rhodanobacteraceae bacterium]
MSKIVNVHEAKTQLSRLLDKAHAGEEIVIGKAGKPYARLVPLEPPPKRTLGFIQGHVDAGFFDPLPEAEIAAWETESP